MEGSSTATDAPDDETFVNYLPGGPSPSTEPGRIERFVQKLLRRRGALRPVTRNDD